MEQPKIPTLKDAQKPQVKIKGLGAGLTLFDRLKQFKKKDLAFILAGLGTLFMAPLAEHFMMAPENGDASLQKGWGGGSGSGGNFFGTGSSPYENGNNSIAQGGAIGGSGDIITPLNVRDPSALVMGPGGTQQPNAGSVAPPTAPPTAPSSSSEDLKDALAHSASRAASAAVKKAPLPIPKIAVGGSGLRGLGVAGGGSSASGGMAPISSGNLGTAGTGGGGLNLVRSAPNFRGAAGPRGNGPQGLDGTKRAGQNAGDAFSRTGSALSGLNAAASEQIPTGGSGFNGGGQGGAGANDKNPGGSGPGGSKSVGESLAFIEAKERMMENLKLEFEKRKLKDPELLMYGIRNEVVKASALKLGEKLTEKAICVIPGMGCPGADAELSCSYYNGPASGLTPMCGKDTKGPCWTKLNNGGYQLANPAGGPVLDTCVPNGKDKGKTDPKAEGGGVNTVSPVAAAPPSAAASSVNTLCTTLDGVIASFKSTAGAAASGSEDSVKAYTAMRKEAAYLLQARNSLTGGSADGTCGSKGDGKLSVNGQHPVISTKLAEKTTGVAAGLNGLVGVLTPAGQTELTKQQATLKETETLITDAEAQLKLGESSLDDVKGTFALPPEEAKNAGLSGLGTTLTAANTLKAELVTFLGKAKDRQTLLEQAQKDLEATAKAEANTSLVMGQNDEYDLMKKSQPALAIPDADAVKEGEKPAPTPAKTYAEVTTAIKGAKEAILEACGGKKCEAAPAPAAGAAAPTVPDMTNNRAVLTANQKVKEMRDAQRGYLLAIQDKVIPAVAPK